MTNSFIDLFQRNMKELRLHRAAKQKQTRTSRSGTYESLQTSMRLLESSSDDPVMNISSIEQQLEAVFSQLEGIIWESATRTYETSGYLSEGRDGDAAEATPRFKSKPRESIGLLRDHAKLLFKHVREAAHEALQSHDDNSPQLHRRGTRRQSI